jgi:hypothetical protein
MRRRLLVLAGLLVRVSWSFALHAQEQKPIYFGAACLPEGVDPAGLSKVLRAELSPVHVEPLAPISDAVTAEVVVLALDRCTAAPPSVRVSVWHGVEQRDRIVVLADVPPEDRTRTLALALAETLIDPAVSRPAQPEPIPWAPSNVVVQPDRTPIAARPVRAEQRERSPWKLRGSLAFRYATETSTPAAGVFGGVAWSRVGAGASLFGARRSVSIGEVTLWVPSATAYYDLAVLSERLRLRSVLDLGAAIATGAPRTRASSRTQGSFHAALHANLVGTLWSDDANDVEAALGIGYASSLRAQADGKDVVSLDGLLLTAEISLGFH